MGALLKKRVVSEWILSPLLLVGRAVLWELTSYVTVLKCVLGSVTCGTYEGVSFEREGKGGRGRVPFE